MRNRVLFLGAVIASAVLFIALLGVPFWISNGTFGWMFLDKPGFLVVAVNISKNGTIVISGQRSGTPGIYA